MTWQTNPELLEKRLAKDKAQREAKKPDRAAYMRAYRLANAERIRQQERERYALSRNKYNNNSNGEITNE
jgi:hypothetical protein